MEKDNANQGAAAPRTAAHTPGPWKIEPQRSDDNCEARISSDLPQDAPGGWGHFASVVVRMLDDAADEPEGLANAKLIAAAPTLAAALTAIANELGETGRNLAWARLHARAALRDAGLDAAPAAPKEPQP